MEKNEQQKREKIVLECIKQGKTTIQIAEKCDVSVTTIRRVINKLIAEGKIEKSDVIYKKDKNKENAEIRNEKILEDLNKGISREEIAKKYNLSKDTIYRIAEGKYKRKMVKKKKYPRRGKFEYNPDAKKSNLQKEIFEYLKKGCTYKYIEKQLNISSKELLKEINNLYYMGVISNIQIKEYREKRKKEDEKLILEYLKNGYRQRDILKNEPELNQKYVSKVMAKLRNEGKIVPNMLSNSTKENNQYKNELKNYSKENNRNKEIELNKIILKLLNKGYTEEEIEFYLKVKPLCVRARVNELKERNLISDKEMDENIKKRKEKKLTIKKLAIEEYHSELEKIKNMKNYFEICKKETEVGNKLNLEDIKILEKFILLDERLLNTENLRLLILQYINYNNYYEVNNFLNKLIKTYGDTKYENELIEFKKYVHKKMILERKEDNKKSSPEVKDDRNK